MTISISWVRKIGKREELLFASDSRLRCFGSWDANPKIFQLDRTDCAICFAGDTQFSYPIINQMQMFVKSYPKSKFRFQDLTHFKGQLLNMMNFMLSHKSDYEIPEVGFLFGGYSWERKKFLLWNIYYDKKLKLFVCAQVRTWKGLKTKRIISFIGDYHHEYQERLKTLMRKKKKFISGSFDMEPFEILRDMLLEDNFKDIGGPPQLLKVYEHMNRSPIAVEWDCNKIQATTLLGRPLQNFEVSNYPKINPHTLIIEKGSIYG